MILQLESDILRYCINDSSMYFVLYDNILLMSAYVITLQCMRDHGLRGADSVLIATAQRILTLQMFIPYRINTMPQKAQIV